MKYLKTAKLGPEGMTVQVNWEYDNKTRITKVDISLKVFNVL